MTDGLSIVEWVHMLRCPDNREAYRALQSLQEASELDNAVYAYIDTFIEMMRDSNSYIRTRGLTLIAHNAKWDEEGKIDGVFRSCNRRQAHYRPTVHKIPPETCRSEAKFDAAHRFVAQANRHFAIR